nr:MAG TPA: hypothetical protein [Caudoviricetes sp.]
MYRANHHCAVLLLLCAWLKELIKLLTVDSILLIDSSIFENLYSVSFFSL